MPVIDDDGEWIADSGDICAYLDQKYDDQVMGEGQIPGVAEKFFPSFVGFLKSSGDEAAEKEAALSEQLKQLDTYLAENGPYLGGEEMKAADAMLVCIHWPVPPIPDRAILAPCHPSLRQDTPTSHAAFEWQ